MGEKRRMRTVSAGILTVILCSIAHAAPPPDKAAAYRAALKEGRALADKKDPGAVAAFQRALEAMPDDPAALSELGLAQLAAKDLAGAEASERKAAAGGEDAIKAGAFYNLALVLKAKGDKPGAVEALKQSLAVRPRRDVLHALAKLDAKAAAAAAPQEPALEGPYATIYAFLM
jgi:tetratricopeptide (TPR) repeat protein